MTEAPKSPNAPTEERVLAVKHYTDKTFWFRITRPSQFRFRSGEFVMIGLMVDGKPLLRAYSMTSPAWADHLEFYSIKAPDGPLTTRLQNIAVGDTVLLGRKPTGTLTLDSLLGGDRLYMFSTGTGVAPFASLIREPETYERFGRVILCHTCRIGGELTFSAEMVADAKADPLVGEMASKQLTYVASTTREPNVVRAPGQVRLTSRSTDQIASGELFRAVHAPPFSPVGDRAMLCGSIPFIADTRKLLEAAGLREGKNAEPAEFVVERAFVS